MNGEERAKVSSATLLGVTDSGFHFFLKFAVLNGSKVEDRPDQRYYVTTIRACI